MSPPRLIMLPDATNADPARIVLTSPWEDPAVPMMSYLLLEDRHGRVFLAQTVAPQLNVSQGGGQDKLSLPAFSRLNSPEPWVTLDAVFLGARLYQAEILGEVSDGRLLTHGVRPDAGATGSLAPAAAVASYLGMPTGPGSFAIGTMLNVAGPEGEPVEVRIDLPRLFHHVGVCGATGCGKTETTCRIVAGAAAAGVRPVILDLKPDYQGIDLPSDEPDGAGLPGVKFFTLADDGRGTRVEVMPSDLDPAMLASTVFHRHGEELQAEAFERAIDSFRQGRQPGIPWSWTDLTGWLQPSAGAMQPLLLGRGSLDSKTWDAVMRKVDNSRSRLPGWIARQPPPRSSPFSAVGQSSLASALLDDDVVAGAPPVVVRISKVDARSYGLFLSYLLGFLEERRRSEEIGPQLVVIDEAADIFRAESAHLRSAATDMLGRHIAKGRSQKLAYLIATQSAADIPEGIRLNLNTMIAGRHRHPRVLKEALPDAGFDVSPVAARLRPGEMLVELFKLPLLRVGMYRSPMRLS